MSSFSGPGGLVRSLPSTSPGDAQAEAAKLSVNRILQAVMAMPPKASPKSAAEQAAELSPEDVSLLIVKLCQMLQTLVREVEIEREQMLDAQSALTEVLQRVVAQDASWTQQQSSLQGQEAAIKELAVANARLRTQLLPRRRRPRAAAGKAQPSANEAASLEVGCDVREDTHNLYLGAAEQPAPEAERLLISGASKPRCRRSDGPALAHGATAFEAASMPALGHGVFAARGALHSLERRTRQHRADPTPARPDAPFTSSPQEEELHLKRCIFLENSNHPHPAPRPAPARAFSPIRCEAGRGSIDRPRS